MWVTDCGLCGGDAVAVLAAAAVVDPGRGCVGFVEREGVESGIGSHEWQRQAMDSHHDRPDDALDGVAVRE